MTGVAKWGISNEFSVTWRDVRGGGRMVAALAGVGRRLVDSLSWRVRVQATQSAR